MLDGIVQFALWDGEKNCVTVIAYGGNDWIVVDGDSHHDLGYDGI